KEFVFTHLVSAMIPAFFLAAAISTFFSRETLIKTMGSGSNPVLSYPLAALAGGVLTVCSCGILPIFMSLYLGGAGLGPAITFLYASPAINLISLIYTWKILPISMLWARVISVFTCSMFIGVIMAALFRDRPEAPAEKSESEKKKSVSRTPFQDWCFFGVLVVIMLTSTEAFSGFTQQIIPVSLFSGMTDAQASAWAAFSGKILVIGVELLGLVFLLRAWFTWDETRKWVKRTGRQMKDIIPMVFLGIFYSGMLGGVKNMTEHLGLMSTNSLLANLASSFIGAILYFGSIVGVNVVDIFRSWGMHDGPALSLLLAGPTISLPSILATLPIIGYRKSLAYAGLVVVFSAACGLIYGSIPH
ncbi:MAG TPA: permease, partial [Candidatus Ozemobacteraceae bacterium]|nr:permease [Candidatus Ozemobacteraceae bacterium]